MKRLYVFWEQLQKLMVRPEDRFGYRVLLTVFSQLETGKIATLSNR